MRRSLWLLIQLTVSAQMLAQTPVPPASALIPGTNLFRCATPVNSNPISLLTLADCTYNSTNPSVAYAPTTVIGIPVVVHVIQNTSGQGNLSDAQVQSQITVLNEDFRAMAGTAGAAGVDTKIQFFLANTNPTGGPTNGIMHYTNNTWFTDSGSYWNTIAWPTQRYLNIYTNNCGGGSVLGYVPDLPQGGSVLNTNADRVVILYSTFGRPAPLAPYNLGRTCTHEVGHYLGLFHTFEGGCGSPACYTSGDRICDTAAEANARFGCPGAVVSCSQPDPVHNYLDYTDDSCMNNFTQEQARRMRCTLQYYRSQLDQPVASAVSFGTGCYTSRSAFAQTFAANTFDLAGTASTTNTIAFVPTSLGYTIQQGVDSWFTPASPDLALADNALVTLNLPFVFNRPGGSTSIVRMSSNGFVWLNGTSTDPDPTPSYVELTVFAARCAPLWMDLNPAAGGTTHFDIEPGNTAAYFTWSQVPAASSPGAGNTFQLVLRADGTIEYRYRQVPNQSTTAVVGWSKSATLLPTPIDISTAMPFEVGLDFNPLSWTAVGRPVTGTTQTITLGNIAAPASSIGLTLIGWTSSPAGVNLAPLGAPDCLLYVQSPILEAYLVTGATQAWNLAIPANPALAGSQVITQGALMINGVNALGALTANAVQLIIGTL